jgi:hypothetical protein
VIPASTIVPVIKTEPSAIWYNIGIAPAPV